MKFEAFEPGNVGKSAKTLVDVIILRIFDDCVGNELLIAKYRLVVVICRQVTVDHLRVISHSDLKES